MPGDPKNGCWSAADERSCDAGWWSRELIRPRVHMVVNRLMKVDRVLANHSLSSTASQGTSNIPFPSLLLGCNRQAKTFDPRLHGSQEGEKGMKGKSINNSYLFFLTVSHFLSVFIIFSLTSLNLGWRMAWRISESYRHLSGFWVDHEKTSWETSCCPT